jgi:hypothetical protein
MMNPGRDLSLIPVDELAGSRMLPPHLYGQPLNLRIVEETLQVYYLPVTFMHLAETYVVTSKDPNKLPRPGLMAMLQRTIAYRAGWEIVPEEEPDAVRSRVRIGRRRDQRLGKLVTFTMADAIAAGLPERNPTYKSYPDRMLFARACTKSIGLYCPQVLFDPAETADRDEWQAMAAVSREIRLADAAPPGAYHDQPEAYTDPSGEKYDPDDATRPFTADG